MIALAKISNKPILEVFSIVRDQWDEKDAYQTFSSKVVMLLSSTQCWLLGWFVGWLVAGFEKDHPVAEGELQEIKNYIHLSMKHFQFLFCLCLEFLTEEQANSSLNKKKRISP